MVMASGMARGRVRRTYIHTYVRTSHFMTFLHEAIFAGRAETEIENNNGKEGETPLKNSVKHPVKQSGNENEKDEGTVQQRDKGN